MVIMSSIIRILLLALVSGAHVNADRRQAVDSVKNDAAAFTNGNFTITFYANSDTSCNTPITPSFSSAVDAFQGTLGCTCFKLPAESAQTPYNLGFGSRDIRMYKCNTQTMLVSTFSHARIFFLLSARLLILFS